MFAPRMYLLPNKSALLLGLLLLGMACPALAEKTDREKPIHIESDKMSLDNANKVSIFEGKVELTQGTLRLIAEKVVVTEDASGHKFCVATGHLASFRQKRDEANEYVEGYGERIEYNTLTEKIDLFIRARVKREQDDVSGDHITYSTITEIFRVNSPEKTGRVRATLQPQNKDEKNSAPKAGTPKTKAVQPVSVEPKQSEPVPSHPISVEPKVFEAVSAESKSAGISATAPKSAEIKTSEPASFVPNASTTIRVEPVISNPSPAPAQSEK